MNINKRVKTDDFLKVIPTMILFLDKRGVVKCINDKGCEMLERTKKEIIGRNWFDNFIPHAIKKDLCCVHSKILKITDNDKEEGSSVEFFKNPIVMKDGREKMISWHNMTVRNNDDEIVGTISSGEDITEKIYLKNKIAKEAEKYKNLIEFTNTAYMIMNTKMSIHDINNHFLDLIKNPSIEEVIGTNPRAWVSCRDIKKFDDAFKNLVFSKKNIENLEIIMYDYNNQEIYVSINASLNTNGKTKIFCLMRDISKVKEGEMRRYIANEKKKDRLKQSIKEIRGKIKHLTN